MKILCLIVGLCATIAVQSQTLCGPGSTVTKQELRLNLNLPNSNLINGYVEYVPSGYWNANNTATYPLVIYVHTRGSVGNGTTNDLCKLFDPTLNYPPYLIEQNRWPAYMETSGGQRFPFITLTPQFSDWDFSEEALREFLQYAIQNYRVNTNRIYLIGASQGAEVIQKFAGAGNGNASSIAAIVPIAACKYITDAVARNIGSSKVGVWTSQCSTDLMCDENAAVTNQAKINSFSTDQRAIVSNFPEPGFDCMPDPHDTWSIMLNQNYRKEIGGRSMNIFDFMISYSTESTLPVKLIEFDIQVRDKKPILTWKTNTEQNGHQFYIERAAENETFKRIDSVLTQNNPQGANYEWIDQSPINGKTQYRLSQIDQDGSIAYFSIKWVTLTMDASISMRENPFRDQLRFEIIKNEDPVLIRVIDISGKIYFQQNYANNQNSIPVTIPSSSWPNGIYIIQYGNRSIKVLKQ